MGREGKGRKGRGREGTHNILLHPSVPVFYKYAWLCMWMCLLGVLPETVFGVTAGKRVGYVELTIRNVTSGIQTDWITRSEANSSDVRNSTTSQQTPWAVELLVDDGIINGSLSLSLSLSLSSVGWLSAEKLLLHISPYCARVALAPRSPAMVKTTIRRRVTPIRCDLTSKQSNSSRTAVESY